MKTIILLCLAVLLCGCVEVLTPPHHYVNASKLCEAHGGLVSGTYHKLARGEWFYQVNCANGTMREASFKAN